MRLYNNEIALRAPTLSPSDISCLARLRGDPEIAHLLVNRGTLSCSWHIEDWIRRKTIDSSKEYIFLVCDETAEAEGQSIGFTTYSIDDPVSRVASLGICLDPLFHGKGYGCAAIGLMMNYLENVFAIQKFTFQALATNDKSRKAFSKLGFNEVGMLKRHFLSFGRYHDVVLGERLCDVLIP